MGGHFDNVVLPDYNGVEGAYNAKLNAATGKGEYVMHSGGAAKDRPYDAVGSQEGDIYIVGFTQSAVIDWGGTLTTKIIEEGVDQNDDIGTAFQMGNMASSTSEYQFFAVKLATSEPGPTPSCIESCSANDGSVVVKEGNCYIDNICYRSGETAEMFGRPCLICDADQSQTDWSFGPTIGVQDCFIDNVCREDGEFLTFRESRSVTHTSACQVCSPAKSATGWSTLPDFVVDSNKNAPNDCLSVNAPVQSSIYSSIDTAAEKGGQTLMPPTNVPITFSSVEIIDDEKGPDGNGLSTGAVVGIVVGMLVSFALALTYVVSIWWKRDIESKDNVEETATNSSGEEADGVFNIL